MKLTIGCCLLVGVLSGAVWAEGFAGGTGEPNDPYQIATAADLIELGNDPNNYDKHFILTADIDLDPNLPGGQIFDRAVIAPANVGSGGLWSITSERSFEGVFNGDGYVIYNLTIEGQGVLGLFGDLGMKGQVTNLGLEHANVVGSADYVGMLVGWSIGSVSNCYSTGTVSGENDVGGLVGLGSGAITSSYSMGAVSGSGGVGGLVGYTGYFCSITSSYSVASVNGENYVGGLVGNNHYSNIIASYSNGAVSGDGIVGGLVGYNNGFVAASFSNGAVSGTSSVGGLAGFNCSYITTSYSAGVVRGNRLVGGLVGYNQNGYINFSHSVSKVIGSSNVGGLVGFHEYAGLITLSFWDTETSGLTVSAGGMGLSTAQMQDIDIFLQAGWDFAGEFANGTANVWSIQNGDYPRLAIFNGVLPVEPQGSGTREDPYLLSDANELGSIWYRPGAHYRLIRSIDLTGIRWNKPVIPRFDGSLDGQEYIIRNLHIEGVSHLGLIGILSSTASLSNLGLEAADVNGIGSFVGALVGRCKGAIDSCYSSNGTVRGNTYVGGLVGQMYDLQGRDRDGAVAVISSYSTGMVSGNNSVGGLVGFNDYDVILSYSTSLVTGHNNIGGLVGCNSEGSIISSYSTGIVGGDDDVGGLVGENFGSITSSFSIGAVSGNNDIGGLVGTNTNNGTVTSCFWDTQTSGLTTSAGGTGLSTADMQDANTFWSAGWDFVDEIRHGTADFWSIQEGDYPRLVIFTDRVPVEPQGSGTQADPYLISNAIELGSIWYRPYAHYRLVELIDFDYYTYWNKAVIPRFYGSLDGDGHIIRNLRIHGESGLGLVGFLSPTASISDLALEAVYIKGEGSRIGAFAGTSEGSITSCYMTGYVKGDWGVGGFVGKNFGSITSSFNIVCNVDGQFCVGGLVGSNDYGSAIKLSYSVASVSGDRYVGGLVGYNEEGFITSSYSNSDISADDGYAGGLIGFNWEGMIASCYSAGSVTGDNYVGGLVGVHREGTIASSYSICGITGDYNIGGLVGNNTSTITSSFWDTMTSGQIESEGGVGLATTDMKNISTFLDAGWDFVDETENGTDDIWYMPDSYYPRLQGMIDPFGWGQD